MNQAEALRLAMTELGEASSEELAAHIGTKYGVTVRPQFVPVLKATLKDKELLAEWRRKSEAARLSAQDDKDRTAPVGRPPLGAPVGQEAGAEPPSL